MSDGGGTGPPWAALALAGLGVAAAAAPADTLEFDRPLVAAGEVWRLATGQFVHWTPRMAALDLGLLVALAALLEATGRRRTLFTALALALPLAAVTVHLSAFGRYRGASGLATAAFAALAASLLRDEGWPRRAAVAALAALLLKIAIERASGEALFAGDLPAGIAPATDVHLAGLIAGVAAAEWVRTREPRQRGSVADEAGAERL